MTTRVSKSFDWAEDRCFQLPSCQGWHSRSAHDRVQQENAVYATVFENGDPRLGSQLVMFYVLPLLDLIGKATGQPRCWRCGKIGPTCEVRTEMMKQPDGTFVRTVIYCGID